MNTYTKEIYSEICKFLRLIGNKYVNKIPSKLLQLFEKNQSNDYIPHINPNIPIKEQSLNEDTLAIIALLNLKYWCNDERKKDILAMLERNQKKYEDKVNDIFNQADNISGDESSLSEYNSNSRPKEVVVTGSPRSSSQATATMEPQNKIEHQTTNASENAFEKLKEETSIIEKEEINIFKKIVSKIKSIFVKSKQ